MPKIILAGAGTAGHVEPALAVARWIREHAPETELLFLGTATGVENRLVPAAGFPLVTITKAAFPRTLSASALTWPVRFGSSLLQVRSIIRGSALVIGFGGYVCAPAYSVAKTLGIPFLIHEANAKAGMANRLGAALGGEVLRAFGTSSVQEKSNNVVGIPLRSEIVTLAGLTADQRRAFREAARSELGLDPAAPTLLIFGGSLGSLRFNQAISNSLEFILAQGIQVIHAVGGNNELPYARPGYHPVPYIDQMAKAYGAADVVIARSGAVTTTETGLLGIYSIYIPLDIGNGEQRFNAEIVTTQGGGEIVPNVEFSAETIKASLARWLTSADEYRSSGKRIDFPVDAAAQIGQRAIELITAKKKGSS